MRIIPDIERIHLRALVAQYGLQATLRALGVAAGEYGAELEDRALDERYQKAAKYLYDRASRAPSVEDL